VECLAAMTMRSGCRSARNAASVQVKHMQAFGVELRSISFFALARRSARR
jgi:hypothetical protein